MHGGGGSASPAEHESEVLGVWGVDVFLLCPGLCTFPREAPTAATPPGFIQQGPEKLEKVAGADRR